MIFGAVADDLGRVDGTQTHFPGGSQRLIFQYRLHGYINVRRVLSSMLFNYF